MNKHNPPPQSRQHIRKLYRPANRRRISILLPEMMNLSQHQRDSLARVLPNYSAKSGRNSPGGTEQLSDCVLELAAVIAELTAQLRDAQHDHIPTLVEPFPKNLRQPVRHLQQILRRLNPLVAQLQANCPAETSAEATPPAQITIP